MSLANDLRRAAAIWPQDWPPQDRTKWEIAQAFLGFDEYLGDLAAELPWFLLLVAAALDDCALGVPGTSNDQQEQPR
jgi:hypothetical protein